MEVYKRLDELTLEGIAILQRNEYSIAREWERLLRRQIVREGQAMQWDQETFKSDLETMMECLRSQLFFKNNVDPEGDVRVDEILSGVKHSWRSSGVRIDQHQLTYMCYLLEHVTHKAIDTTEGTGITFRNHQAVHHFFTVLNQRLMPYPLDELNVKSYLDYLLSLPDFSVRFVVRASYDNGTYNVKDVVQQTDTPIDPSWLHMLQSIQTESVALLQKAVLRLMGEDDETNREHAFISREVGDEWLIFYVPQQDFTRMESFLNLAVHMFREVHETASQAKHETDWHVLVSLFYEWVMRAQRLEDAFEHIASGYVRYLPFERCALFLYLPTERKGVGLTGYNLNVEEIKNITEHFSDASMIQQFLKSIRSFRPLYIEDASESLLSQHYSQKFQLKSLVVSPIYSLSKKEFIGAVFLDQGEGRTFEVNDDLMNVLVKMGHHVGEILMQYQEYQPNNLQQTISSRLSPREIEVLHLVKNGNSINEISIDLHLSQYTVRDYVSSSIKKMNAKNRTHAVAIAIQQGLI